MCRIAKHYGTLPHKVAHLPYHYWIALRNEYLDEMEALAKAMKPKDDENVIEIG